MLLFFTLEYKTQKISVKLEIINVVVIRSFNIVDNIKNVL